MQHREFFLVFVCFEANAIQKLFPSILLWKKKIFKVKVFYGLVEMQHREFFSGFGMF